MKEEEILQILLDWNFWEKKQDAGIERASYETLISPFLSSNQAIVISGVRRSGKSTIMLQLAKKLIDSGTNPKNILIINFEDYRFYGHSLKLLQEIYEIYLKKISLDKKIIFLDEIHKIEGWEKFVRTLLDKKEAKIIVSGSNSKLISKEYASLLTGRHVNLSILPLNFKEFLDFKGLKFESELQIISKKIEIQKLLEEYLEFGAFPEVILSDEITRKKILADYFDSIITKDVAERHKIKEKGKLVSLARFYVSNISGKISFNKLKEPLNMPLRTIERFSYYLEEAFLIFFLKRFSFKLKEQEKSKRKVYSVDLGLSNTIGFSFKEEYGKIIENAVFLEFIKRNINSLNFEIYYWQDLQEKEVDFVIKDGKKIKQLIQVCYELNQLNREREITSLIKASEELKCDELLVINSNYEAIEKIKGKNIKFIPLWKWMLLE